MVTGQLTVPCDSLSNLYSHVQLCVSSSMVMPMAVLLQYTVRAMQHNILFSSVDIILLLQWWSCLFSVSHHSKYALL